MESGTTNVNTAKEQNNRHTTLPDGEAISGSPRAYRLVWMALQPLSMIFFGMKRKEKIVLPEGPCLILANHTNFFDPLILISRCKERMNFVAGEHLFRSRFINWFLSKEIGCVACAKGENNAGTVKDLYKKTRRGEHVCLFGEGNITYDGSTDPITVTTGKLVKMLKCPVATVKITGGYAMMPRWSLSFHRGHVHCKLMNIYEPEQIRGMTPEAVTDLVNKDLYQEEPVENPDGKRAHFCRAKGLKLVLYACPCCKGLQTVQTKGRTLTCSACGAKGIWTKRGSIESTDFPYHTLYEWNRWQQGYIPALAAGSGEICIQTQNASVWELASESHTSKEVTSGMLTLTRTMLSCGEITLSLDEIAELDTRDKGVLIFSTAAGDYYEIRSKGHYPGLLYKTMYQSLMKKI